MLDLLDMFSLAMATVACSHNEARSRSAVPSYSR